MFFVSVIICHLVVVFTVSAKIGYNRYHDRMHSYRRDNQLNFSKQAISRDHEHSMYIKYMYIKYNYQKSDFVHFFSFFFDIYFCVKF